MEQTTAATARYATHTANHSHPHFQTAATAANGSGNGCGEKHMHTHAQQRTYMHTYAPITHACTIDNIAQQVCTGLYDILT